MADPRFFTRAGPFPLAELAAISGAALPPGADPARTFADVAPLDAAGPDAVSFLDNPKYAAAFEASRAGACLVHPRMAARAPAGMAVLAHAEPYLAYARVAQAFYPDAVPTAGIAPGAHVDPAARLGPGVRVEPGAAIAAGAEIGEGTVIGANATLGRGVVVGRDCRIGPGATLQYCLVGARVIVHAGARIGQDGFGFAPGASGLVKVPQLGRVLIGDDVEIGANTTIDRGAGPDTVIGAGTKIDNLVQIAHNVRVGRGCVIVSQVGISGSTQVGDFVMMGGQAGLTGHLAIGKGARIAAQSGVMRDVPDGATVVGSPAYPVKEFWRQVATLEELAKSGRRK